MALVVSRRSGESLEITHEPSGDVLRVDFLFAKSDGLHTGGKQAKMAFSGDEFSIVRTNNGAHRAEKDQP